ncbi:MAG: tRNA-dihydrouridine synthase family protein [Lachnospiraceae bacterium]|nr:tRNA-dihydrouridine synthase family protein [Lachnospiraceae bacterium]
MQFYLAPMQEVTGWVYRNVYSAMFGNIHKYFTPFIVPTQKKILKTRERKEVAPENNRGLLVVPQIMTNHAEQFIDTCHMLMELGYHEVNLNLGCPAATVVTKARGSGFLADTGRLDRFFEDIFLALEAEHSTLKVSVKTRIGLEFSEEFEDILKIYNQYPLSEIIIHPRLQKDYYGNHPNLEVFSDALNQSAHPVCYNGDIFTKADYEGFIKRFPSVDRIMLGRGVIGNPGLVREIVTGQQISKEELQEYHDRLYAGYRDALGNEKDVLFKMKEVWYYLGANFLNAEKELKKIRKAGRPEDYGVAVKRVFEDCEFSG